MLNPPISTTQSKAHSNNKHPNFQMATMDPKEEPVGTIIAQTKRPFKENAPSSQATAAKAQAALLLELKFTSPKDNIMMEVIFTRRIKDMEIA